MNSRLAYSPQNIKFISIMYEAFKYNICSSSSSSSKFYFQQNTAKKQ